MTHPISHSAWPVVVPENLSPQVERMIHAQEDREAAMQKAEQVVEKLAVMKLGKAAETGREGYEETLRYMHFPREHWRSLRTNNPLERIMKEIRRRTRVVGSFPDGRSALMLLAARRGTSRPRSGGCGDI